MYAIFKDGGRQHKVQVGTRLMIDYRGEETKTGSTVEFDQVLAISGEDGVKIGQPTVSGAKVVAEVLGEEKGPKLVVAKFRRRKNSRRKTGHRQTYTLVRISEIVG
ncbi:MAG TPA: 50S ribosomal protein L21 [Planctomycetaceae bacterium]|nr:50S ribosomal protein L21 [Planctomycetaceae bacterium]